MRIAIAGKGGVGKTTLTALLALGLFEKGYQTLAVDSDANPNLGLSLGVSPEEASAIKTLLELNEDSSLHSFRKGKDLREFSYKTPAGVSLTVLGRVNHADTGCLCRAYQLLSRMFEMWGRNHEIMVLADMAAGLEYMKRGAVRYIDALLVVAEPYFRSMQSAVQLKNLAEQLNIKHVYGVINKVRDEEDQRLVEEFFSNNKLKLIASLPFDERLAEAHDLTVTSGDAVWAPVRKVISQIESDHRANLLSHLIFSLSEKFLLATPSDLSQREILAVRYLAKEGQMTMSELARSIKAAYSTATAVIDNLARKKFVRRVSGAQDRRVVLVSLSDSGKEFYKDHVDAYENLIRTMTRSLNKEEESKLLKLVQKISTK
ncbi:MAG: AAA family ATPase [bacterium]